MRQENVIHNWKQYQSKAAHPEMPETMQSLDKNLKPVNINMFKECFSKDLLMYLFIFRQGEGREKGRERNTNINVWLPLMRPLLGTWPQPRHVPWVGIKPATLWFAGWHSIYSATPVRAVQGFKPAAGNFSPMGQIRPTTGFINNVSESTAMCIHFHVSGEFCVMTAKLSSYDRDSMDSKA